MENRIEKSHGPGIPKKSRSLDLKTLYRFGVSKEGSNEAQNKILKRKSSSDDFNEKRNKNKKSRKEVPLSSLKNVVSNSKKSLGEVFCGGLDPLSPESKGLKSGFSQKLNSSSGLSGISLSLSDNVVQIPKRKRDFVGRRKFDGDEVLKPAGQSSGIEILVHQVPKVNCEGSSTQDESSIVKQKKDFDDFKENKNGESNTVPRLKEEEGCGSHSVANSGDASLKKSRRNRRKSRKSKDLVVDGKGGVKEAEPLVDNSIRICDDLQEVNDENLEQNVKQTKGLDACKENQNSESNSVLHLKEEDGCGSHSVVNNGDKSLKKSRRNRRKRKDLAPEGKRVVKETEPLADNSIRIRDDLQEDDEENLEQNAARMLSSRFDPSCTGFSLSSKASASADALSFLLSSGQDFSSPTSKSLSGSESASVDTTGRVLRPRTQHKAKGHSRKRRHFYEIFSGNLDAYWVLNRKIKVFWPLDQSWYYGLVNDYDRERKLHHVKYDDRDEEWINLQSERIKLLLLPNEVPGKAERKKSGIRNKYSNERKVNLKPTKEKEEKSSPPPEDDSFMGNYLDSEPIIYWLARSTRRVKSTPFSPLKKQKMSAQFLNSEPLVLSNEAFNVHKCLDGGSLKRDRSEVSTDYALLDSLADSRRVEKCDLESTPCQKDNKIPIVYFRRRFRKTSEAMWRTYKENRVSGSASEPVTSLAPVGDGFGLLEEHDISLGRLDPDGPLLSPGDGDLLKLTIPSMDSRQLIFYLSFPVHSVMNHSSGAGSFWLCHAVMLLQYGTVMTVWPNVHLEMLFVDNIVGLRFLLFEGCLMQAVAFIFLVLMVFHQSKEQGKYIDLQFPVTSIRFKFSYIKDLAKQLVFSIYNFSELKKSKWIYLDSKLKRHCFLTKQLPLSECTHDNIKELQNGTKELVLAPTNEGPYSIQGMRKRSRMGISHMGVSRDLTYVDTNHSSSNSDKYTKLPPFALSFTAAPSFFLGMHLKLLMELSVAHISFQDLDTIEHPENSGRLIVDNCSCVEECSNMGARISVDNNLKASSRVAACDGWLTCAKPELGTGGLAVCGDGNWVKPSWKYQNGGLNVAVTSVGSKDPGKIGNDDVVQLHKWRCKKSDSELCVLSPSRLLDIDKSDTGSHSCLSGLKVEIPPLNQNEKPIDSESHGTQQPTDLTWNMNCSIIPSPNPTAPRSTWHRSRNNSNYPSFGSLSHVWSDGNADIINNSFGNGPKKPRTQVSYTSPFGGFDISSKHRSHPHKRFAHKQIRRANEKRSTDVSRVSQRNFELLSCDANVLITLGDRGWRECGVRVVLELVDHNEWRLLIKLSGTTKYSYKAHQFLQPGTTNRYTHAMMWKGGKDWILEFSDRSQWTLFKEMHEECYNRNIRAASVKNIPIPGVRMIEENEDNGTEVVFLRSSKYFRQVETDVDMALNPSHVLYDMDSDDEQWILKQQNSSEIDCSSTVEISEEMFEKTMDMFEKAAYTQKCDQFTPNEIEDLGVGVGPMEVVKSIYEHWWQQRQKKGMPLIRHLQPALWERYRQQMSEWELAMTKINATHANGCQEKAALVEKPPMFAFCLKPRGLEVPNKGSKQRSHRKFSVAGQNNVIPGDQDSFHAIGRRLNGFAFGDEKGIIYPGHNREYLDDSPLSQTSPRVFSPRDAGSMEYFARRSDGFDRNHYPKLHRNKSRRFGTFVSTNDQQMVVPYNQTTMDKRNGLHRWSMGFPECPSQRHYPLEGSQRYCFEQLDGSDLDEFRLRDAAGATQDALNMAKLKRERAQRLLYRADLAIHKAVVALMTAEAIKASSEDSSCDG